MSLNNLRIQDCQSEHLGLPSIRRFSEVAPQDVPFGERGLRLRHQSFDTYEMQAYTASILSTRRRLVGSLKTDYGLRSPDALLFRLRHLVAHALENVPFYKERYSRAGLSSAREIRSLSDFNNLPSISKTELSEAELSARVSERFSEVHFMHRTSGSSGRPFDVIRGWSQYPIAMSNYIAQLDLALGREADPSRWIYNIHHARWWLSALLGEFKTFTLSDIEDIGEVFTHVRHLKPEVLMILPSYLNLFAEIGKELRGIGVEAIVTNSEQSSREERLAVEKACGVKVHDEYSSVELQQIAFECQYGSYHVFEDNVYVTLENVGDDGVGSVVGTNLFSWKMPFIRYEQGDFAEWSSSSSCICGRKSQSFAQIHGRKNSSFYRDDGSRVPSASLLRITDKIMNGRELEITSYRLHQLPDKSLRMLFASKTGDINEVRRLAFSVIDSNLSLLFKKNINIDYVSLPELPALPGSKRQLLVCEAVQSAFLSQVVSQ